MIHNREAGKGGTGFYDEKKRFRGWASLVTKRGRALSDLTVIDVVGADPGLTDFLSHLDRSRLVVEDPAGGDSLFTFRWASGYVNGNDIRIQGILDRT